MSYFEENYKYVLLSIDKGEHNRKGLRRAQLGAVHAIASHFTLKTDPAMVVMPTGSGKTAVLMISAFLLEAKRVLVITPSRLVRNEIAIQFGNLSVLKKLNVVPNDIELPKVHEQTEKITSLEDWTRLEPFDVVVATPQSVSPAMPEVPSPPDELFDLILVDEAHHSPAKTWDAVFNSFPNAKRLLVTATPFRRDKREIKGKFVYVYPLREAYKDKIFGQIQFLPVEPGEENSDIAIARMAEQVFNADKAASLHHALMVRTDSKRKANELETIYAANTRLKLRTIHSSHSYSRIQKAVADLKSGELDGVICVNMMGEGFDFPNLKIAAIHTPHKSLAITLQFIGRFARTNAGNVATAKFLAVPAEIMIESTNLYDEDAVWQEIVINLSRTRIHEEVFVRETIDNFEPREETTPDQADVSLYTLKPYGHVKVYKISGDVNLYKPVNLPGNFEIYNTWDYTDLSASFIIAREIKRPKWSKNDNFLSSIYHLFIFYYDADSKLLFINSTLKQTELYEDLARSFTDGTPKILPLNRINKVLLSLSDPSIYNLGMKNRLQNSNSESYRNIVGPSAGKAVTESDGQLYHRGHIFGGDSDSTIGFSSSSKIWSNARFLIPNLIEWCKLIAGHLTSNAEVVTHTPLDYLQVGQDVSEFPDGVIGILWDQTVFKNPPAVKCHLGDETKEVKLLDIELSVNRQASNNESIRVLVSFESVVIELDYRLDTDHWFNVVNEDQLDRITVTRAHKDVSLVEYLNSHLPEFFFSNFSRLHGSEIFPGPGGEVPALPDENVVSIDWAAKNIDIEVEFGDASGGLISIHAGLMTDLEQEAQIVFYDHGSGEIADFITFKEHDNEVYISFFHCKGSSGVQPGERVKDYYEVCMQVVKSLKWIENNSRLLKQIEHREAKTNSRFIKGSIEDLELFLEETTYFKVNYKLVIVQPGISKGNLGELSVLLAATSDYVNKSRGQRLDVWCSA